MAIDSLDDGSGLISEDGLSTWISHSQFRFPPLFGVELIRQDSGRKIRPLSYYPKLRERQTILIKSASQLS